MEGISVEYFTNSVNPGSNESRSYFHSYISNEKKQDSFNSHAQSINLLENSLN